MRAIIISAVFATGIIIGTTIGILLPSSISKKTSAPAENTNPVAEKTVPIETQFFEIPEGFDNRMNTAYIPLGNISSDRDKNIAEMLSRESQWEMRPPKKKNISFYFVYSHPFIRGLVVRYEIVSAADSLAAPLKE